MIAIPLSVRDIPPDHPVRPLRNATGPSVCTCGDDGDTPEACEAAERQAREALAQAEGGDA